MTALRQALPAYLDLRHAMGFSLGRDEKLIRQYLGYLEAHGADRVTVDSAVTWAVLPPGASPAWLRMRIGAVRAFAAYLVSAGLPAEIIPPDLLAGGTKRAVPYLYSDQDIAALLRQTGRLRTPLRCETIRTLISLLAVTGMRIGEAIDLDDADFDPAGSLITVRRAKFGKHRLLPLHPSATAAVSSYRKLRDREFPRPATTALLVSGNGTRLRYDNVSVTFAKLARRAGLQPRSARCRPRPHDLRHTMAVNTLLDWYRDGGDIASRLPLLSAYLGHSEPASTYWYLSASPELLAEAARRLSVMTGGPR
jgi:integrase/recombinase XerD